MARSELISDTPTLPKIAVSAAKKADPSDADIDELMIGNICRCGTYQDIRRAIHRAAELKAQGAKA